MDSVYPSTTPTRITPRSRQLYNALADLSKGLQRRELWSSLGWHDIRQRYRRSTVGPFWLTISMAAMIAGIGSMYAGLFGQDLQDYLPYVATGIIVFGLITSTVSEATVVFISAAGPILQIKAPLSIYIYQMIWRNFIIFAHNITIYFVVIAMLQINPGFTILLALPGLFLITIAAIWTSMVLGTLSARFRDVPPIVGSVMQVSFFLTPIFWRPESIPNRQIFIEFNPFYYFIEIVRQPLLGNVPSGKIWLVAVGINIVGATVAVAFFKRFRARIAYWL